MGFFTELEKTENKTFTENGDIAYRQILKAGDYKENLKLFGLGGAMRYRQEAVPELFGRAFAENEALAVKNLFYLRDCRGGKGERELFRVCLDHLAQAAPDKIAAILPFIPEYGRGDDLLVLVNRSATRKAACSFIKSAIEKDMESLQKGAGISILAKWLPKPNATAEYKRRAARAIAENIGMTEPEYRKAISGLRSHLNLVETALTNRETGLDYASMPSQAMLKHSGYASRYSKHRMNAFPRNDSEGYNIYMEALSTGNSSVNVTTLNPVQVYRRAFSDPELAQAQWDEIEKRVPATDKRIIIVRDGSGSMRGEPLDIATSLTILASGKLSGEFKDKFITFSSSPRMVDLKGCVSLAEKRRLCEREAECSNTNIEKTYELILETSKHCAPKDYITNVVVISDMQFDMATMDSCWYFPPKQGNLKAHRAGIKSTFEKAKRAFKEAGIPFPTMTFWNVDARELSFPTDSIEGVQFVSGYSDSIYASILEHGSVDAVEFMLATLEKYDKCGAAWEKG